MFTPICNIIEIYVDALQNSSLHCIALHCTVLKCDAVPPKQVVWPLLCLLQPVTHH